jgi:hypothetical protein
VEFTNSAAVILFRVTPVTTIGDTVTVQVSALFP